MDTAPVLGAITAPDDVSMHSEFRTSRKDWCCNRLQVSTGNLLFAILLVRRIIIYKSSCFWLCVCKDVVSTGHIMAFIIYKINK